MKKLKSDNNVTTHLRSIRYEKISDKLVPRSILYQCLPFISTLYFNIIHPSGNFGPSFTTYNATIPEGLTIIAIYFIVTAVIGLILFERKEFN
jgi:hypothetical protein